MSEAIGNLVEATIKQLVNEPDEVKVNVGADRAATIVNVTVAPNDVGRVIGKDGRVITNIRHFVSAAAGKSRVKAIVKVNTED